jgi:transcriptional regulator with XRE-family HTH domain
MDSFFPAPDATNLGEMLRKAREVTGLSTRAVAAKLDARLRVSHTTIANYEKGRSTPPLDVLAALAEVYGRPLASFLESGPSLTGVRYRNLRSKVGKRDLEQFEANAQRWLEAYVKLEERLQQRLVPEIVLEVAPEQTGRQLAKDVRRS